MPLEYTTENVPPDITVLRFTGRLMIGRETQTVEALVLQRLREGGKKLVVDLTGVNYIDSAGVGCLAASAAVVQNEGGALVLAGAGGLVLRVLELTQMDRVLRLYPSVPAACEALQAS
jgi:anti-sigma B factor antagonist